MSDLFFWVDLETTSLEVSNLTVLEVAWTVTNSELVQLTPLRSRFTALVSAPVRERLSGFAGLFQSFLRPDPVIPVHVQPDPDPGYAYVRVSYKGWTSQLDPTVVEMHEESGLRRDWLAAPSRSVLLEVGDLDRLFSDDLAAAGFSGEPGQRLFLAGAGVEHFDRLVLRGVGAEVVDEFHYRPADVSSAFTVLGMPSPKTSAGLEEFCRGVSDPGLLSLSVDSSCVRLTAGILGSSLCFDRLVRHRAADDVATALVAARGLRALARSGGPTDIESGQAAQNLADEMREGLES